MRYKGDKGKAWEEVKKCISCYKLKRHESFSKDKRRRFGISSMCKECENKKRSIKNKKRYYANIPKARKKLRDDYHANAEHKRGLQKKYRDALRRGIVEHYSKGRFECACCLEKEYVVLTIDHIHGGGTLERRLTGGGGQHFYRTIKKANYPEGFQILCFNCNVAKWRLGRCYHQKNEK